HRRYVLARTCEAGPGSQPREPSAGRGRLADDCMPLAVGAHARGNRAERGPRVVVGRPRRRLGHGLLHRGGGQERLAWRGVRSPRVKRKFPRAPQIFRSARLPTVPGVSQRRRAHQLYPDLGNQKRKPKGEETGGPCEAATRPVLVPTLAGSVSPAPRLDFPAGAPPYAASACRNRSTSLSQSTSWFRLGTVGDAPFFAAGFS